MALSPSHRIQPNQLLGLPPTQRCNNCGRPLPDGTPCVQCRKKRAAAKRKREQAWPPAFGRRKKRRHVTVPTCRVASTPGQGRLQVEAPGIVRVEPSPPVAGDTGATTEDHHNDQVLQLDAPNGNTRDEESGSGDVTQECAGCGDSFRMRDLTRLASCEHVPQYCGQCFLEGLSVQINDGNPENILCLSHACSTRITYEDIRALASSEMFEQYENILALRATNADPNFQRCLGQGCDSGQIHDSTNGPIFTCFQCRYRMCTAHDPPVPLHQGESCAQYTLRNDKREQEKLSLAEAAKIAVACPDCGTKIQKTGGCDHMTCRYRGCGMEFCYVCRAPYAGAKGIRELGNTAHVVTCRYHASRLR